ncbi:MAG: hypothetical protein ACYCSQ_00475 [bacterium]
MATLKTVKFNLSSEAGDETLDFKSDISVDKEGEFHLTIPEEIADYAQGNKEQRVIGCGIGRNIKGNYIIISDKLDTALEYIGKVCKDYLKCEIKQELVIIYRVDNKISYKKNKITGETEASPFINQEVLNNSGNIWEWEGDLHAAKTSKSYSVGIAAKVRLKKTYIRRGQTKVEYKGISETSYLNRDEFSLNRKTYGHALNSLFIDIVDNFKEMPYTEEAAKFFYDLINQLCKLADKIDTFINNEKSLIRLIESNNFKLLAE